MPLETTKRCTSNSIFSSTFQNHSGFIISHLTQFSNSLFLQLAQVNRRRIIIKSFPIGSYISNYIKICFKPSTVIIENPYIPFSFGLFLIFTLYVSIRKQIDEGQLFEHYPLCFNFFRNRRIWVSLEFSSSKYSLVSVLGFGFARELSCVFMQSYSFIFDLGGFRSSSPSRKVC